MVSGLNAFSPPLSHAAREDREKLAESQRCCFLFCFWAVGCVSARVQGSPVFRIGEQTERPKKQRCTCLACLDFALLYQPGNQVCIFWLELGSAHSVSYVLLVCFVVKPWSAEQNSILYKVLTHSKRPSSPGCCIFLCTWAFGIYSRLKLLPVKWRVQSSLPDDSRLAARTGQKAQDTCVAVALSLRFVGMATIQLRMCASWRR